MNELPASKTNISFCMRILLCLFSSLGKKTAVCQEPFCRPRALPSNLPKLSCCHVRGGSRGRIGIKNLRSLRRSRRSCRIEMSLLMRKVILNCKGPAGQARCEPELKLGALSNANLLPDPGSKILPTSWKPSKTVRSRPSFSAGSSLQALTDELA